MNGMNKVEEHPAPHDASWFEDWFASPYYVKLYSHRDHAEAAACADLIVSAVDLGRRDGRPVTVLDLASGPGRHAIAFAERGFAVTAVDLSPTLLAFAQEEAEAAGVAIDLARYDMREIPFVDRFDLAVQLFTSFGYFESQEEDELVLRRVRRALREGGYYALDIINESSLRRTLVPRSTREVDGITVVEERRIENRRVIKEISIDGHGHALHYHESVRLYSPDEIDGMLRRSGFEPVRWFGGYRGEPFDPERSQRMLVISRTAPVSGA
jgi:SAM-dependent methyltransferase